MKKISRRATPYRSSDPRFSVSTNPRFKPTKKTKIKVDADRFQLLKRAATFKSVKRDQYGRKINVDHKKKILERLYELEDDADEKKREYESDEPDADDEVLRELAKANQGYDPARQGGFESSSEDESSSGEDEEEQEGGNEVPTGASMQRLRDEAANVQQGEVTDRIAIVNLDWDHVKAVDLMAVFSSFLPTGGTIKKVSIYPSEFGKERMRNEDTEGPPRQLFKDAKRKKDHDDDKARQAKPKDNEDSTKLQLAKEGDDEDFDSTTLRAYQLDRLRYFYAVMQCSDKQTAKEIYDATDGREYLSSSNLIDLRFVPDHTMFEDEPHDECEVVPKSYKPVEFITDALSHSRVKLTWDLRPEEAARKESIKQAFSGGRAALLEEDLKVYLASDTEREDGNDADDVPAVDAPSAAEDKAPLSKKELARRKLREKLGLTDEPTDQADDKGPVGDMTVTFGPALIPNEEKEETTIEKYKRKEKERREKRRARYEARRDDEAGDDDDADDNRKPDKEADMEIAPLRHKAEEDDYPNHDVNAAEGEELGFNDPFFTTAHEDPAPQSKTQLRKEFRRRKREARETEEAAAAAAAAVGKRGLELGLPAEAQRKRGFDMLEIIKEEKREKIKVRKKTKRGKRDYDDLEDGGGEDKDKFVPCLDERFFVKKAGGKEWDIDPLRQEFTGTQAAREIREEMKKGKEARKRGRAVDNVDADAGTGDEIPRGQKGG